MPDNIDSIVESQSSFVPTPSTPPKPKATHKAYVPSPFTPMDDLKSLTDEQLKVRMSAFIF